MTLTSDQTATGITVSMTWPKAKQSAKGPSNGCAPVPSVLPWMHMRIHIRTNCTVASVYCVALGILRMTFQAYW